MSVEERLGYPLENLTDKFAAEELEPRAWQMDLITKKLNCSDYVLKGMSPDRNDLDDDRPWPTFNDLARELGMDIEEMFDMLHGDILWRPQGTAPATGAKAAGEDCQRSRGNTANRRGAKATSGTGMTSAMLYVVLFHFLRGRVGRFLNNRGRSPLQRGD
jgi:hypothetical protein